MCHESSSHALAATIGIGKASVTLDDVHNARLLILAGQNGYQPPADAVRAGDSQASRCQDHCVNPLREAGLINFRNPQKPRGLVGKGTDLADLYLPIKINGDLALFQAWGALLVEWNALDHEFIERYTRGFASWRAHVSAIDWDFVVAITGLSREQITEAAQLLRESDRTVLLGHGADPASQRGSDHFRDCEPCPGPGQHWQAWCRALPYAATPTCRATARWASARARRLTFSTDCRPSSDSSPRERTAMTPWMPSARCAMGRPRSS